MTTPVVPPTASAPGRTRDAGAPKARPWSGAVAGASGAGAALGGAELWAGVMGRSVPSPVAAVGDAVIDLTPGWAVRTGIDALGTADKPVLLVGIVCVTLLIGAALDVGLRRRRLLAGFVALAGVALWAAARQPAASLSGSALAYGAAAAAGVAVAAGLGRLAPRPPDEGPAAAPHGPAPVVAPAERTTKAAVADVPGRPRVGSGDRRTFLALAGGAAALAATAGVGGRRLADRFGVARARAALALPAVTSGAHPGVPAGFADVRGLSPFVTPNRDFYRIDTALVVPQLDPATWRLRVTGLVERQLVMTFDELAGLPIVEEQVTLSCVSNEVGGDLVGNANWRGIRLADVLERAGVRPEATQVVAESADGFTAGFPLVVALDGRPALVALGMNGEPLPVAHGFPCRLVVGGLYGYVSATKWLTELRLTRWDDEDGYWIPRGWAKEGPIKTQSRIDVPRPGVELPVGTVPVAGVAWAPTRGIAAVQVRVDDGPWQPAELAAGPTDATWVQWLYRWPAEPGAHRLTVRAVDGTGTAQPAERRDVAPDGATGHHSIEVSVV